MIGGTRRIGAYPVACIAVCIAALQTAMFAGCDQSGEATVAETATVAEPLASAAVDAARQQAEPPRVVQPTVSAPAPVAMSTVRIEFDPPIIDMGPVVPNQAVSKVIQIRNPGDKPVRILSVKPSCKCTTIGDLTGTIIAPGESVPLEAELEAQPFTGVRTASISVVIEGASDAFTVDLRAEVTLAVRVTPSILNLASGQTTGHIVVASVDGQTFNVLSSNRRPPDFVGFDPDFDEPRSSYVLRWDLTDAVAQRALDRWWIIESDHPDAPLTDAWVRHMSTIDFPSRSRPWRVPSRRSIIGFVDKGGSKDFTIDVEKIGTDAIYAIRSLTSDFTAELISFERKDNDAVCTVRITPKPGFTGILYGRIDMLASSTDHKHDVIGKVR